MCATWPGTLSAGLQESCGEIPELRSHIDRYSWCLCNLQKRNSSPAADAVAGKRMKRSGK